MRLSAVLDIQAVSTLTLTLKLTPTLTFTQARSHAAAQLYKASHTLCTAVYAVHTVYAVYSCDAKQMSKECGVVPRTARVLNCQGVGEKPGEECSRQ